MELSDFLNLWLMLMPQIKRSNRSLAALFYCLMSFAATNASGSVTLLGNRVIYPADMKEKTLQFTNEDNIPALIQIWLDINNPQSTPENADAPFIASPQIFRIAANSGQMVRLSFVGQPLPTDRESLFYLNFLQIPGVRQADSDKNKLLLLITNRVKVFYRPAKLAGDANHVIDQLSLHQVGNSLKVNNPTGYYANVSQAIILKGMKRTAIPDVDLIQPFSDVSWPVSGDVRKVELSVINDYGVEISRPLNVTH